MRQKEIASLLGVSEKTVKNRKSNALTALRVLVGLEYSDQFSDQETQLLYMTKVKRWKERKIAEKLTLSEEKMEELLEEALNKLDALI